MSVLDSINRVNKYRILELERKKEPIPCINCITLPICISELKDYRDRYAEEDRESIIMEASSYMYFNRIRDKCSLVSEYIFASGYMYFDRLKNVVAYMLNEDNERDSNERDSNSMY